VRTLLRRAAATTTALGTLTMGGVALAPTASAASCGPETELSVDHRGYWGPWPDNWELTSQICSYRSGSYVYSYAYLSWDSPGTAMERWRTFDSAAFRLYMKRHDPYRTDPTYKYRTVWLESRMESHDDSIRTSAVRHRISKWAYTDGAWKLGWDGDGDGWIHYGVRASDHV
jgi:hypothetical protein